MAFTVEKAGPSDAEAIANILFGHDDDDDDDDELMRLQLGSAVSDEVVSGGAERVLDNMQKLDNVYMIAREQSSGHIMAFAHWILPEVENGARATDEEKRDNATRDTENLRQSLAPGMNVELILRSRSEVFNMRETAIRDRPHYLLANIMTLPRFRRQGAASALIRWAFDRADHDKSIVYLDTREDGMARPMYERLGFHHAGQMSLDLTEYGGTKTVGFIAMVRETD